jgi:hypothetical protein
MKKLPLFIIMILLLIDSILYGQNNIKHVKIFAFQNEVLFQPQLNDFFDEDILGAVNSGMNITFHFYTELRDAKKKLVKDQENQVQVRNDVWENQYILSGYKLLKRFNEFQQFKNYMLDSLQFKIEINKKLNTGNPMQLILTFSPQKISQSQKGKIREWLKNEENDSESTLSLNLSKLISFFLSDEKNENLSIYRSETFTLKSIKADEQTPQ